MLCKKPLLLLETSESSVSDVALLILMIEGEET